MKNKLKHNKAKNKKQNKKTKKKIMYWVPVVTSFNNKQQYGSASQINLFSPNLLFGHGVSLQQ